MNKNEKRSTEYAGFVRNRKTGEYDKLYHTTFSVLLAKNRAIENAGMENEYSGADYDVDDVIVKQREIVLTATYGEWERVPA